MKPRAGINRKKKAYFTIVAIAFASMVLVAFSDKLLPPRLYNALSILSVAAFTVGVLLVYVGIRCPGCGKILGLKFVFAEESLTRCPRCGIDFDEEAP